MLTAWLKEGGGFGYLAIYLAWSGSDGVEMWMHDA